MSKRDSESREEMRMDENGVEMAIEILIGIDECVTR